MAGRKEAVRSCACLLARSAQGVRQHIPIMRRVQQRSLLDIEHRNQVTIALHVAGVILDIALDESEGDIALQDGKRGLQVVAQVTAGS